MLPLEAVHAALQTGITTLCFTEHMDLGHHLDAFNRVPDFHKIHTSIQELQSNFPLLNICCGLEVGYISSSAKHTAEILFQEKLDYVLLSTHCVDGLDCYLPESKRRQDKITAYRRYLETLYASVSDPVLWDCYDCIGHIGYIAKCRHYEDNSFPYDLFPDLFDTILLQIIKSGKGIEVNTSGLSRVDHLLPHPSIIARYHELGGRIITLGSDAHKPEQVGAYIRSAINTIRDCGFHEIATFHQRKPQFHSI